MSTAAAGAPLLEVENVSKRFGGTLALEGVSLKVEAGAVTCLLGDNGAGKSTLIRILAGVHAPSDGALRLAGRPIVFRTPREALARGIATVHQDLALVPLLSVWRNFFLGAEPTRGAGPFRRIDVARGRALTRQALAELGIDLRDADQPVGTLSGGERQALAIARALHFGARVLILDEPTAALGVKQSAVVLRNIAHARAQGVGIVFVTHNPQHAHTVGDRFVILKQGRVDADLARGEVSVDELVRRMASGEELERVRRELGPGEA